MRAEQNASYVIHVSEIVADELHIQIGVQLQTPATEPDPPGVGIALSFEPNLPLVWQDKLHPSLYNGVHRGISLASHALPSGGVDVIIHKLDILPLLTLQKTSALEATLGTVLEYLTGYIVASLLNGIQLVQGQTPT